MVRSLRKFLEVVLPIHIGAFPAVIAGILSRYTISEIKDGDVFLSNSPWEGGSPTQSPDFAVAVPVFHNTYQMDKLVAFAASIAHKSDIGGAAPWFSCPATAKDTFFEGLHRRGIPPIKLISAGRKNDEAYEFVAGE